MARKIRDVISRAIVDSTEENRLALWVALKLNTNPSDSEDRSLVEIAKRAVERSRLETDREALLDRTALLLKHDWDRAKRESGADLIVRRLTYDEFVAARDIANARHSLKGWSGQRPI